MPSSLTQSNPPGFELVKIDKASFKERFAKVYKSQVEEARLTLNDILELKRWLAIEDFAYAGRKWKEYFKSKAKVVGFDRQVQTVLSSEMPAGGIDLAEIRRDIQSGHLKKPAPKISSSDIAAAVFGEEDLI